MPRAMWNDQVLAETESFETVEGNVYFPRASINEDNFEDSGHTSVCPWKGTARYFHVVAGGACNENAAWYYPDPKEAAANIKDHIAFWKGVKVEK